MKEREREEGGVRKKEKERDNAHDFATFAGARQNLSRGKIDFPLNQRRVSDTVESILRGGGCGKSFVVFLRILDSSTIEFLN